MNNIVRRVVGFGVSVGADSCVVQTLGDQGSDRCFLCPGAGQKGEPPLSSLEGRGRGFASRVCVEWYVQGLAGWVGL